MCVNIIAAKALFLEITGTNSLCHITSWTKHSRSPPPLPLLDFILRAMAQEKKQKKPGTRVAGAHTNLGKKKKHLFIAAMYQPAPG